MTARPPGKSLASGKFVALGLGLLLFLCPAGSVLCSAAAGPERPVILKDSYLGRRSDAPWRKAAAERIDKYRKADLTVVVRDGAGRPLQDAAVHVQMKRHRFWFGSRVDVRLINADTPDARLYRQHFLELFNYATVNTVYYFQWKRPELAQRTLQQTLQALPWLRRGGYTMRGHTLVWWFKDENIHKSPQQVYDRVVQHIRQTAGNPQLAAAFDHWDVQNEPFSNSDIFKKLGPEKLAEFFRLVHQLDPDAKLFLNECNLISQLHKDDWIQRCDFIYRLVKDLKAQAVPIHGLGLQSHHIGSLAPIGEVLRTIDRFAELGLDLHLTEYDIKLRPASDAGDWRRRWRAPAPTSPELEQLEGEYLRDFLTATFSHPAIKAFIMWGFWDGRHWLYNGPLYRKDWSLKPAGKMYRDLVLHQWWTDEKGKTDGKGRFRTRGFLGDYEITVQWGGEKTRLKTKLKPPATTVRVVF